VNDDKSDLLAGTLDLLILQALSAGPLHGLGVSRRIAQITRGAFDVKAGSLFPALQKLEQEGWLSAEWGRSDTNRRAKYYSLTKAGRRQLAGKARRWNRIAAAIRLALQAG
jgi:PadR family transcriptional regulator, regulatory protein PadR